MNGSKVFSKLDLKWGYHQLELSPESREIATFATPHGLFRYKRLPFDVCSASEKYQHEIASALAGIEGVENISDDIVVHGAEYVRFVAVSATPTALTTREIEEASADDEELREVRKAIATGRFEKCRQYTTVVGELCVIGQLVLRGTRIIIPSKL